jgi:hypothetical protein
MGGSAGLRVAAILGVAAIHVSHTPAFGQDTRGIYFNAKEAFSSGRSSERMVPRSRSCLQILERCPCSQTWDEAFGKSKGLRDERFRESPGCGLTVREGQHYVDE